ncbi:MAG: ATP-dependent Clp protease adaptor ClpS, partial [Rhizobium sp.]|nr:ATP-dependent Clp protease adaptor ClpS [Rhizobium sp.]
MIAKPVFMQSQRDGDNANKGTSVITRTKPKTKKPDVY